MPVWPESAPRSPGSSSNRPPTAPALLQRSDGLRCSWRSWQSLPQSPKHFSWTARWAPHERSNREGSQIRCDRRFLRKHIAAVALAALPIATWAGTGVPDEQLWTELDVTGPLTSNTTVTGIGKVRWSESLANPTLTSAGLDVNHKTDGWLLSAGYRHELTPERPPETIDGKSVRITQIALLMGTYAKRFGRSTLAVRIRFDDTITASSNPYRARLRIEYRWAVEGHRWMSYLYTNDEVFYEFQDQAFFRNRFQAGMNLLFSERTALRVYYLRQDSNNTTPGAINALGLTANVTFK